MIKRLSASLCLVIALLYGCTDSPNGRLKWRFSVHSLRFWEGYCSGGNPVVGDGVVFYSGYYFWSERPVDYAIDAVTGRSDWRLPANSSVTGARSGIAYVTSPQAGNGATALFRLAAMNLRTRRELWHVDGVSNVRIAEFGLFVRLPEGHVQRLAFDTGAVLWTSATSGAEMVQSYGKPEVPEVIILDGVKVHFLDVNTGADERSFDLPKIARGSTRAIRGEMALVQEKSSLVAVNLATHAKSWEFPVYTPMPPYFYSSLVFIDGNPADQRLYALNLQTGKVAWVFNHGGQDNLPLVSDGVLYYGGHSAFYALDPATGREDWHYDVRNSRGAPVAAADMVFFGSEDCHLYALTTK